jgi:hypothetical protein
VDPYGRVLARAPEDDVALLLVDLDLELIEEACREMPLLRDRRPETYFRLAFRQAQTAPNCSWFSQGIWLSAAEVATARTSRARATTGASIIWPSRAMTPSPRPSAASKASSTRRA